MGGHLSVCQVFVSFSTSICLYVHALVVRSCINVGLSYQLINIIVGHMQCHVRLVWILSVFLVMILMQCFCLLGLEANRCVLRLHAEETVSRCRHLLSWFFFLCSVFITSQATATTTTPPVTVMCSGASSLTMTVTMVPTLMGLPVTLVQHDVVLSPPLMLRDTKRCCWPCYCAAAATSIPDTSSGMYQLCLGSSTVKFLFQSQASHWFAYIWWCLLWCMFSDFQGPFWFP